MWMILNWGYLHFVPSQGKCIILGCQWFKVERYASKQLVWASEDIFSMPFNNLVLSKIALRLSYSIVPANEMSSCKNVIFLLVEASKAYIYDHQKGSMRQQSIKFSCMVKFINSIELRTNQTLTAKCYQCWANTDNLPFFIQHCFFCSSSWIPTVKSSSGWSSGRSWTCLINDFHFAIIISPKPSVVDVAHQ